MSVGGELKSAGLSASLALGLNLWPITHCAQPIRQERTLPLVLWGQFAWRLRRCSEWADAFREAEKKWAKVMWQSALPCVWFAGLSAELPELRWRRGTKHGSRRTANGLFGVKRVRGWVHLVEETSAGGVMCSLKSFLTKVDTLNDGKV